MPRFNLRTWFRNISIRKKLNFTIGIMALLILTELFTLWFSLHLLSGVRASVQQEGVWSKAQKDAINTLQQYALTSDSSNFTKFKAYLEVHRWDRVAFQELRNPNPNQDIMYEGFVRSGIHPEDGNSVVDLFYYFNFISYVDRCLTLFWTANELMLEMEQMGITLHQKIHSQGPLESSEINSLLSSLQALNAQFTILESDFSNTLGNAARWLDSVVLKLLFAIALTVEISGILLAISLSRGISKGINEVIRVSKRVAAGDFNERAQVFSKDEIGILAESFNEMIDEVKQINSELQQFAYVASHDLQEPLRTIANYNTLLQDPHSKLDPGKRKKVRAFISSATERMQALIRDLMLFARVGRNVEMQKVNMQNLVTHVVEQLQDVIWQKKAVVEYQNLPTVLGNEVELNQLFQNLISNAIKFHKKGEVPQVKIAYSSINGHHVFSVTDKGIGIPRKYYDRIFAVFQRLHNENEYPGTGIGLATCKKIITLHKGKLEVHSEYGHGTEFRVSLPKQAA